MIKVYSQNGGARRQLRLWAALGLSALAIVPVFLLLIGSPFDIFGAIVAREQTGAVVYSANPIILHERDFDQNGKLVFNLIDHLSLEEESLLPGLHAALAVMSNPAPRKIEGQSEISVELLQQDLVDPKNLATISKRLANAVYTGILVDTKKVFQILNLKLGHRVSDSQKALVSEWFQLSQANSPEKKEAVFNKLKLAGSIYLLEADGRVSEIDTKQNYSLAWNNNLSAIGEVPSGAYDWFSKPGELFIDIKKVFPGPPFEISKARAGSYEIKQLREFNPAVDSHDYFLSISANQPDRKILVAMVPLRYE